MAQVQRTLNILFWVCYAPFFILIIIVTAYWFIVRAVYLYIKNGDDLPIEIFDKTIKKFAITPFD